jgi:hypothetical protein
VLQLVHERQLMVHAQSIPGGLSRRVTAYAVSPEATEAFRREHPPPPDGAYYRSSSEDDECKYPDPMPGPVLGDGADTQADLRLQDDHRRARASAARSARYAGEHVPVHARLAEIKDTVERRLHETADVSPWFGAGVHWLCKLCGHHDPAMQGKNWVDEDDPGDERVYGIGHGWCQDQAKLIAEERKLAHDIAQSRRFPGETELEVNLRESEGEANFRAAYPSYRGPWPLRLPPVNDIYDVRDGYYEMEIKQPYVDESPRTPVPVEEPEPELDPIPDAVGQPPFTPRTGRPTAYWGMGPACK